MICKGYHDAEGKKHELFPYKTIAGDVKNLLDSIAPALGASVGALGDNLQFFVFNDLADDAPKASLSACCLLPVGRLSAAFQ